MLQLLSRLLIRDSDSTERPEIRRAYGVLSGSMGIVLNFLLFLGKLFAGWLSGSIAVAADAMNNLTDAGSSIVSIIGFRLAAKRPDAEHPYGYGRVEYISGLIVAILILLTGVELIQSSVKKIVQPEATTLSALTVAILIASILVKLVMWHENRWMAHKLNSAAIDASAADSLSDTAATGAALLALLLNHFAGWAAADGWCGIVVSLFILYSGWQALIDTSKPLLGGIPDKSLIDSIELEVRSHPEIIGVHDLLVHDYGPGRRMISLHAEVPADGDMIALHEVIDRVEHELREKLSCDAVIHMDPVQKDSDDVADFKERLLSMLTDELGDRVTMHDFHMEQENDGFLLTFDILIPHDCQVPEQDIQRMIRAYLRGLPFRCRAVVQIDRAYI